MEIKNKKANFDYFIEDTIECGIELKGTEIKSLRNGSGDLRDTFAVEKENKEYKPIKKKNYEKDDVFVREFVRDEFSSIC